MRFLEKQPSIIGTISWNAGDEGSDSFSPAIF